MEGFYQKGHTVCSDNFFTSFRLAVELLRKKTTLIFNWYGQKKRELPSSINIKQDLFKSLFYEHDSGVVLNQTQFWIIIKISLA